MFLLPSRTPGIQRRVGLPSPKAELTRGQRLGQGETHRLFTATHMAARLQNPFFSTWLQHGQGEPTQGALPLLGRAVGLPSLAAAQGDGVKVVEGTEGHPRDGDQG